MQFGMPTLIEINDLEATVKLCKELSLSFVELNMNLPQYQADKLEENTEYLLQLMKKYSVYFTLHLDENLNICDFNSEVRSAYLSTVQRAIKFTKRLNIPIINMHMNHGVYFTLPDRKVNLFEQYKEHYLNAVSDFISVCETAAGDSDIKICIENTDGFRCYEEQAIDLLLKNNLFGLTWDIGHSNAVNNLDEKLITDNAEHLAHFHIHDSLGKSDHMTLGTGEIDLQKRLKTAEEHNCRCVVETKTVDALKKSVSWLKENKYLLT